MTSNDSTEFVYLISLKLNNSGDVIYKLGKTTNEPTSRIGQYRGYGRSTANTIIIGYVSDCDKAEKDLLNIFNKNFVCAAGKEYFFGDVKMMVSLFYNYLNNTENMAITDMPKKINTPIQNNKKIFVCFDERYTTKYFSMLSYREAYELMKIEKIIFHDNSKSVEKIKLYIRMKIKINESRIDKDVTNHTSELLKEINNKIADDFKIINPSIIILISNVSIKNKRNLYIIYKDVVMPSQNHIRIFMNHFPNPMIDMNVYRNKYIEIPNMFTNSNKKYIFHKSFNYESPKNDHEFFMDICTCSTNIDDVQENVEPLIKKNTKKIKAELLADKMIAVDENDRDINYLLEKKKLKREEKNVLEKMFFMKLIGIDGNIGNKKLKKLFINYYDKQKIIKNFEIFFGFDWEACIPKEYIEIYHNHEDQRRDKIIINFLNILLNENKEKYVYDDLKDNKVIEYPVLQKALEKIRTESIYFDNEKENNALFYGSKNSLLADILKKKKDGSDSDSEEEKLPKKKTNKNKKKKIVESDNEISDNGSDLDNEEIKKKTNKKKTNKKKKVIESDTESDDEEITKNTKKKSNKKKVVESDTESDDDDEEIKKKKIVKADVGKNPIKKQHSKETVDKTNIIKFIAGKLKLYGIIFKRIENKARFEIETNEENDENDNDDDNDNDNDNDDNDDENDNDDNDNDDGNYNYKKKSVRGRNYSLYLDPDIANIIKNKYSGKNTN